MSDLPTTRPARRRLSVAQWLLFGLTVLMYGLSLIPNPINRDPGWIAVVLGWILLFQTWANTTWLANPLAFAAWALLFCTRRRDSMICAAVALAIAASYLLSRKMVDNEGGVANPIGRPQLDYWLWLMSMALTLAATFLAPARPLSPSREHG